MTREETIKLLKYNSNVIHTTINKETDPREVEALDMAIKALEQQDILDKIRAEIEEIETYDGLYIDRAYVLQILDKYKAESEG